MDNRFINSAAGDGLLSIDAHAIFVARTQRKRTSQELDRNLNGIHKSLDDRDHKKRCYERINLGNTHPTQFLTLWSRREHKPVALRTRDSPTLSGFAKWYAEVEVMDKRFITPQASNTRSKAHRQASDMACWWIFHGSGLERAGLMSLDEYCASTELSNGDLAGLSAFPEPLYRHESSVKYRKLSTFNQSLYPRVFSIPRKTPKYRINPPHRKRPVSTRNKSTVGNCFLDNSRVESPKDRMKINDPFPFTFELPYHLRRQ